MPAVQKLRSPSDVPDNNSDSEPDQVEMDAEKIQLYLPSSCSGSMLQSNMMVSLISKEAQLRIAQAYDALAYIKKLRRILVSIGTFKHQNVVGTGNQANTRIRSLYDKFQGRIKLAATRYRAAYSSLLVLDPNGSWKTQLKVLEDNDIRGPRRDAEDEVLGEGNREHSWIWLVGSNADPQMEEAETREAMRVEWGKTWARAQRWTEEVKLLQEEMRRVLVFLEWRAKWWRSKATCRDDIDAALASGLAAYSEKQAVILEGLEQSFAKIWSSILKKQQTQMIWQTKYDKMPKLKSLWEVERGDKESDQEGSEEGDQEGDRQPSEESENEDPKEKEGNDSDVEMENT